MLKLYKEHSEFNEYTKFDTNIGKLLKISETEFKELKNESVPVYFGNSKTHTSFPRRIYFQITRNCNLECDYCYIKANSRENHLETDVIFALAKFLGNKGLMEVRLTGGEPTLHPYFEDIYKEFRKNNIYVSIATNGLWSKQILKFLIEQKNIWIIVSLDGSKDIHNKYRKNTYDTIIENIKAFKKGNPEGRLRLNTVLTKENLNDIENLAILTKKLNAESITLIPLRPQVRNSDMHDKMISAAQFKEVLIKMSYYKEKYGINFTTTIETDFKDKIMKDMVFSKKSSCAAGREGTNLDFDIKNKKLILYACSYCPASDLNENALIREPFIAGELGFNEIEKITEIWEDDKNWKLFRDLSLKSMECRTCSELGVKCTGSCPIQNIDYGKIMLNDNIKNQYIEQMKKTAEWYCYKNLES
jgi:MoaA/NifB/PqqE/SkfB family radical SAM enzyme